MIIELKEIMKSKEISNAVFLILGAFVSALVSFLFNRQSEREKLRINLQIVSAELVISKVQELIDDLYHMKFKSVFFDVYSELSTEFIDGSDNEYIMDLSNKIVNEFSDYLIKFEETLYKSQVLLSTFESREVILNSLTDKKIEMEKKQMLHTINYSNYFKIIYVDLNSQLKSLKPLKLETIDEMNLICEDLKSFNKEYIDLSNQFKKDIQNQYLSKLFKHKI